MSISLSIVIPAKNEAGGLKKLLPEISRLWPKAEILVVDDGSEDETAVVAESFGATVVSHPYSMGNGAAVKSGARAAKGKKLIFMDADAQHDPDDIAKLVDRLNEGFDMVVGARDSGTHASILRRIGNGFYNGLASWMTEQKILDLTSGFRAVDAEKFRQFLFLLPNGFSYPSTITMAFFRSGYAVSYVPIRARKRIGKSHLKIWKDGYRFFLVIFKVSTLFSPLKIFVPVSFLMFVAGVSYYLYTYITVSRFTNMAALLVVTSIILFLIGLVSEQITTIMYQRDYRDK